MIDKKIITLKDIDETYDYLWASHTTKDCQTKRIILNVSPLHGIIGFKLQYPNKDIHVFSDLKEILKEYNKI